MNQDDLVNFECSPVSESVEQ